MLNNINLNNASVTRRYLCSLSGNGQLINQRYNKMKLYNLITPLIYYFAYILNNPRNHATAQVFNNIALNDNDPLQQRNADGLKDFLYYLELTEHFYENYSEDIAANTIHNILAWSNNLGLSKLIFKAVPAEYFDAETIKHVFKWSNNLETVEFLFEEAAEYIDAETIKGAFKFRSSLEVKKFIFENARAQIDAETIKDIFQNSDNLELLESLFQNYSQYINENIIASSSNFINHWHGNQEKYPNVNLEILAKEISVIAFGESQIYDPYAWQIIKEKNLYQKPQDKILIGFNNDRGEWSQELLELLDSQSKMYYKVYRLSIQDTKDAHFLSLFDAFINPGAGDTFPLDGSKFQLSYLDDGRDHADMEYSYQRVIDFAKQYHIPYMGICNGAQHLILNEGGYVRAVPNHGGTRSHDFIANSGSIIEFFAMNKEEQSAALFSGHFPNEMKFSIKTVHNYAGALGATGNVELGGISEEGVVEAIARNFYQIGFQFHPEQKYLTDEDMVFSRNKNLLFNFMKIIKLSKHVDIDDFNNKLQEILTSAHSNAMCALDKDVCPDPYMVVDFFSTNGSLFILGE